MEKEVFLSRLEPQLCAALLAGTAKRDPSGRTSERDLSALAQHGQCFAATATGAQAVYVLKVENGVAWISAVKGVGPVPWSELLLPVIESQAQGCAAVAFQTARPGLVRMAKRQGYTVTGWILKKALP